MDIVLPNPMANPYKEDLEQLSEIYGRAKERYRDNEMNLEGTGEKVRELIHKHIQSSGIEVLNDEPVSVMDKNEFDARLDTLESDEARASEMQHAVKHELNVRYDEDPVHYGSLQERVECHGRDAIPRTDGSQERFRWHDGALVLSRPRGRPRSRKAGD